MKKQNKICRLTDICSYMC